MSADVPETPDPNIPQARGFPVRAPPTSCLPTRPPEVKRVPDSEQPDYDEEGQRPQTRPDD